MPENQRFSTAITIFDCDAPNTKCLSAPKIRRIFGAQKSLIFASCQNSKNFDATNRRFAGFDFLNPKNRKFFGGISW